MLSSAVFGALMLAPNPETLVKPDQTEKKKDFPLLTMN
jgi:hypothetical protein